MTTPNLTSGFDKLTPDEVQAIVLDLLDYLGREEKLTLCEEQQPSGNFAALHPVFVPTYLAQEQLAEKYVRTRVVGEQALK